MALGNNLKRVKKDSLIPEQKKEPAKVKTKATAKVGSKQKPTKSTKTEKPVVAKAKPVKEKKESNPIIAANLEEKILLGGKKDAPVTIKNVPSRRKSVRKTKLIIEGSLSILEAAEIKKCLLSTFNEYDIIDIQLLNITHIDLTLLQLFSAFIGHYPNKKVAIDSDLPFDLKIIVERAGYSSLMFKKEAA